MLTAAGLLVVLGLTLSAGGAGVDEHLLAGARHFREARYAEALVEFRVAQKLGAADAGRYAAVSLVKLGRPEEAVEAFGGVDGPGRDALDDYYRALAAHDARLYHAADRILAGVAERAGPKIAEQAARMRADIARALQPEPSREAIDWYLERCGAARQAGRPALAAASC
ncbi:MAG TPA: hypothetical protein VFP50_17585, partial [Anaeromyxobacteraceae bacterium]|nr:hypothetical protein [Anaeromyxobacteraceae bacterium]